MKQILMAAVICAMALSCKKENSQPAVTDSFSFGTSYGFCANICVTMFKISNRQLFEDSIKSPLIFSTAPLPMNKYLLAKTLADNFPSFLEANPGGTFGCPDCHDQGNIRIEKIVNGKQYYWNLDSNENAVPSAIKNYVLQIKAVLAQL